MSVPEVEINSCLGAFSCSLDMFRDLLGMPKETTIKNIVMLPYGMCGSPSVRIVVEDEEEFPALKAGEELTQTSPQFKIGPGNYREFVGWTVEGLNHDEDNGEMHQNTEEDAL